MAAKFFGKRLEASIIFSVGCSFSDVDNDYGRGDFFDDFDEGVIEFAGKLVIGKLFSKGRGQGEEEGGGESRDKETTDERR